MAKEVQEGINALGAQAAGRAAARRIDNADKISMIFIMAPCCKNRISFIIEYFGPGVKPPEMCGHGVPTKKEGGVARGDPSLPCREKTISAAMFSSKSPSLLLPLSCGE